MSGIKCVVFDFGGVLLSYKGVGKSWAGLDDKLGLPHGTVSKEVKGIGFSSWLGSERSLFHGRISVEEVEGGLLNQYLNEKYGLNFQENLKPLTMCLGKNATIRYNERICSALKQLNRLGYKTALLTNNCHMDKAHKEQRLPFDLSVFDVVVESCLEDTAKPEEKIYRILEERTGHSGAELLFLDDLKENVEAADKLGWQTLQVDETKEGEVIEKLEELLQVKFDTHIYEN